MLTEESWAGRTFHDSAGSQIKTPGLVTWMDRKTQYSQHANLPQINIQV